MKRLIGIGLVLSAVAGAEVIDVAPGKEIAKAQYLGAQADCTRALGEQLLADIFRELGETPKETRKPTCRGTHCEFRYGSRTATLRLFQRSQSDLAELSLSYASLNLSRLHLPTLMGKEKREFEVSPLGEEIETSSVFSDVKILLGPTHASRRPLLNGNIPTRIYPDEQAYAKCLRDALER